MTYIDYSNPLDPYLTAARFFHLNYDLFAKISIILQDGILAEFEPKDADQEQNEEFVLFQLVIKFS
jgi:hypothetical protein